MLLEDSSIPEARVFSVAELVDYVSANVDMSDFESICDASWALRALANDRNFLLEAYNSELESILAGESQNTLTPQSIILGYSDDFYLRANIWLPAQGIAAIEDREMKLNSYDVAHDHNFNFLTVGYFGSGYQTDVYTYEQSSIIGLAGEDVELMHSGRYRLTPMTTMAYAASKHIHIQFPPEEITVSINLMSSIGVGKRQQFAFDLAKSKVATGLTDTTGTRLFLLSVLPDVLSSCERAGPPTQETVGLLSSLAADYACQRTQSQALRALRTVDPAEHDRLLNHVDAKVVALSEHALCHAGQARQIDIQ